MYTAGSEVEVLTKVGVGLAKVWVWAVKGLAKGWGWAVKVRGGGTGRRGGTRSCGVRAVATPMHRSRRICFLRYLLG